MTAEQIKALGGILGPVREIIGSVVAAAWGEAARANLTAAQAAGIQTVHDSYASPEAFQEAWTRTSEQVKGTAAA